LKKGFGLGINYFKIIETMDNIKVLIADNQTFTRNGIIGILSGYLNHHLTIEPVKNKEELFEKILSTQPHVLIIDFDLFDFNNASELLEIRKQSPCIGILVITDNQSPEDIMKLLDCGITNYILKSCEEEELIEAFNATLHNRKYFSSQVLDVLLAKKTINKNSRVSNGKITNAETEIVRLITQGLTTKEIASQKNLSYHTIITHRKNIFRKLGITSTSELIMYAMRNGIVDSTEYYI
jgi:DNA-binding NarL/FixJ family response regulator